LKQNKKNYKIEVSYFVVFYDNLKNKAVRLWGRAAIHGKKKFSKANALNPTQKKMNLSP